MTIKQLNASHDALEDRIVLRVTADDAQHGAQEFRFWLTRARTLWLMAQVDQSVVAALQQQHPPEQAKQIASFQQEALAESSNFATPFEEAPTRPLGDAPQLVHHMQLSWGAAQCTLVLQLHNGTNITITLTEPLMTQTKLLLQRISAQAGWVGAAQAVMPKLVH
jgi:hypothetical protein